LKVKADWFSDPARMKIEHDALTVYAGIVPGCVPKPISYDEAEHIQIREAAPERCPMWKTQLLDGLLDYKVAGDAIGALRAIHDATAADPSVAAAFADKSFFRDLRISPYLERVVEKHPELKAAAAPIIEGLMGAKIALVHGDYSPKNILVDAGTSSSWISRSPTTAHPAFDLAFFSNHFLLKAVKRKEWSDSYLNMLSWMLGSYFSDIRCMDRARLEADTVRLLAFLFLARVDGKSPAEYITEESDKALIRRVARDAVRSGASTYQDMIALTKAAIREIN
jgi:hypothetical protein